MAMTKLSWDTPGFCTIRHHSLSAASPSLKSSKTKGASPLGPGGLPGLLRGVSAERCGKPPEVYGISGCLGGEAGLELRQRKVRQQLRCEIV